MFVDSVIIISVIVGCLAFFLLVAIFTAIFQRELGTKHVEKFDDAEDSEKERLTPIAVQDEAQVEYTTETVQPENKIPISGYPHAQVNMCHCYVRGLAISGLPCLNQRQYMQCRYKAKSIRIYQAFFG